MIISASRRTDIPAFFGEWMMNRLRAGEVYVRNPFNKNQVSHIRLTPSNVDCIVFWTKNAAPMMKHLDELESMGYVYYFLFTLNPYGRGIECGFCDVESRTETFKRLSGRIGAERVVWRYDPVLLTGDYDMEYHLDAFGSLASALAGYTRKCVFSFLEEYAKIKSNMDNIGLIRPDDIQKKEIVRKLGLIASGNSIKLASCAQGFDYSGLGIERNHCIDGRLIEKLCGYSLNVKKDSSQRKLCGCVESKDIGAYNSCSGGCLYCYANIDKKTAERAAEKHDPAARMLCDELRGEDVVSLYKKYGSLRGQNKQRDLF